MAPIQAETYEEARDAMIAAVTLNPSLAPVVAVKGVHRFLYEADEFPQGHPLPAGYLIAARLRPTASGKPRWERYDEQYDGA